MTLDRSGPKILASHMRYAVKRLALGVLLLVLLSAILLIADRGRRSTGTRHVLRVAILQHANTVVLDEGIRGVIDTRGAAEEQGILRAVTRREADQP